MLLALVLGLLAAASPPPAAVESVARALAPRHEPPPCADVARLAASLGADPGEVLASVAEGVASPPWIGMRAAACAAAFPSAEPRVRDWLANPALPGLAEMVVVALADVPDDRATPLARAALAGPHAGRLAPVLASSPRPAIRALVPGGR
jgi:hypothetical protein